jgi:hypothetical protein
MKLATYLAFNNNNASLVVHGDAARVLKNVGAKLAHKLAVLVVDLYLVCGRALCDDDVTRGLDHGHSIWVEQLTIAFATLPELELESALLVEDLDAVVVGISHYDVVLRVHCDAAWLGELTLHDTEFAKLAVVDHLLTFDLRLWREDRRRHQFRTQLQRVGWEECRSRCVYNGEEKSCYQHISTLSTLFDSDRLRAHENEL